MAKKKNPKALPNLAKLSFEQAAEKLDQIVDRLETGNLELDKSLAHYEEGINLLIHCRKKLHEAEQKIEMLTGIDQHGAVHTEAFDDKPSQMDESGRSRPRKRRATGVVQMEVEHDEQTKEEDTPGSRLF